MMLQQEKPDDFVIATGKQFSVRDFVILAAKEIGVTLRFEGQGVSERGIVVSVQGDKAPAVNVGDVILEVDPRYFRPSEVENLLGDSTKAKQKLGWVPEISIETMVKEMMEHDMAVLPNNSF